MRKKIIIMKKNFCAEPFLGYCPNYIVKRKFLYCNLGFVLQERGLEKKIVVKIVLQYHFCIARGVRLYCSIGRKIVL